jgi:hypothetical protein
VDNCPAAGKINYGFIRKIFMTENTKPLSGIQIFIRVIFWTMVTICVGIVCLLILILWLLLSAEPDDRLVLQNYGELTELIQNENARADGKKLPLFDSLITSNYWWQDYEGNVPPELVEENVLVASNRDGFLDTSSIGLFVLNTESAKALSERLVTKFSKNAEGYDIDSYTEDTLCLNQSDFKDLAINLRNKKDFFEFCTQIRQAEKIEWNLNMPKGDIGFEYIHITQYVGSTFFTVRHGGS